jgi:hypothetical protein
MWSGHAKALERVLGWRFPGEIQGPRPEINRHTQRHYHYTRAWGRPPMLKATTSPATGSRVMTPVIPI